MQWINTLFKYHLIFTSNYTERDSKMEISAVPNPLSIPPSPLQFNNRKSFRINPTIFVAVFKLFFTGSSQGITRYAGSSLA